MEAMPTATSRILSVTVTEGAVGRETSWSANLRPLGDADDAVDVFTKVVDRMSLTDGASGAVYSHTASNNQILEGLAHILDRADSSAPIFGIGDIRITTLASDGAQRTWHTRGSAIDDVVRGVVNAVRTAI